jgi:hypothetical protein
LTPDTFASSAAALLITGMAMIVEPPKRAVPAASGDAAPENAGGDSNGGLTFPAASPYVVYDNMDKNLHA